VDGAGARAGTPERAYLNDVFADLCRIESPSGRERACARRISRELKRLGVETAEDGAGAEAGSECGNLLARVPAAGSRRQASCGPLLLCAHMDTVPLQAPVEPVLSDGIWENANEGILGADNKAAVAVILALLRHFRRAQGGPPLELELLFTVCEEQALAGARAFDASQLTSRLGYVFDHASPIGEVVVASPSHFRVEARFRGAAAHAGLRPEDGRSAVLAAARAIAAMPHGRLDELTTVNLGTIAGGTAMNVVPEQCSLVAEVRSVEEPRAQAALSEIVACMHQSANLPECECDVDIAVQRTFAGYSISRSAPVVRLAEEALRACGHRPLHISTGGGSDANALLGEGLPVANLANGTERNHEPGERVSAVALEAMLEVAIALVETACA
jgi:tripeptide aminopeptidase